jgi:ubiquitin-conjugating enzyme E2 N
MEAKINGRILRESKLLNDAIQKNELYGIQYKLVKEDNPRHLSLFITGPKDTPYDKGIFEFRVFFTGEYPHVPPKVKLQTKIYHPNINNLGEICLNILKTDGWNPTINLRTLALSLQGLLESPNLDDPLNLEVTNHFKSDKISAENKAIEFTVKYAVI